MESRLQCVIRKFLKFVYVEKCCLWENVLQKSSRIRCRGFTLLNAEIAMVVGGSGEEVEVSCALGRGIYAMTLGAEDGGNHIKA